MRRLHILENQLFCQSEEIVDEKFAIRSGEEQEFRLKIALRNLSSFVDALPH